MEVTPSGIRSLTVSPGGGEFKRCADAATQALIATLTVPYGICFLGTNDVQSFVTITNGAVAGHIEANGAPAAPIPAGSGGWTLGQAIGPEVFAERTYSGLDGSGGILLTTSPVCDVAFQAGSCEAPANTSRDEGLEVRAPSSSMTTATKFTITTTWTAVS